MPLALERTSRFTGLRLWEMSESAVSTWQDIFALSPMQGAFALSSPKGGFALRVLTSS
jgi:hypothetical protein